MFFIEIMLSASGLQGALDIAISASLPEDHSFIAHNNPILPLNTSPDVTLFTQ